MIDLRFGRYQDVMRDVELDASINDAPYGARTHEGYRTGADASDESGVDSYACWTPADVHEFVEFFHPRTRGWMVTITSHDLVPAWEDAFANVDRLYFPPVPIIIRGMGVRIHADGPASWALQLVVARPRKAPYSKWCVEHHNPEPYYLGPAVKGSKKGRGKPDWLMRKIVCDYSRAGDLVGDGTSGWGATLGAALATGRRATGAESDLEAFNEALRRHGGAALHAGIPSAGRARQIGMLEALEGDAA